MRYTRGRCDAVSAVRERVRHNRACAFGTRLRTRISEHNTHDSRAVRRGQVAGCDRRADGERVYRNLHHAAVVRLFGKQYRRVAVSRVFRHLAVRYGCNARGCGEENG